VFVTSQGRAYARFRSALDSHNATIALAAARELPHVGLAEALELVLLLGRDNHPRFGPAAFRWHGRFCRETRDVDGHEAEAVLALLLMLNGPRSSHAARALGELMYRQGLERVSEAAIGSASRS
jgi:hypothetical protein